MAAKKIFIAVANLFIALVVFQSHTGFFKDMILSGVEKKTEPRISSWKDLIDGTFQRDVETWLKQHIGFRGTFVKTDNQITYSIFNEFSRTHPKQLILGDKKYLYEAFYVDVYNGLYRTQEHVLEQYAASIGRLQNLLAERGIAFILLISPSKATIYPEFIPKRFLRNIPRPVRDDYTVMIPLLKNHGVRCLDTRALFLELKARGVPELFPTSGTHWSLYSASLVAELLLKQVEDAMRRPIVRYRVTGAVPSREPIELDKDIARLANILFTRSLFTEYLYPETEPIAPPGAYRPRMIIIGTSCSWNIIAHLDANRTFSDLDFYYYFNTRYHYPGVHPSPVDRTAVKWEDDIFSRDVIIMEINEAIIGEDAFGFVEPAVKALSQR